MEKTEGYPCSPIEAPNRPPTPSADLLVQQTTIFDLVVNHDRHGDQPGDSASILDLADEVIE